MLLYFGIAIGAVALLLPLFYFITRQPVVYRVKAFVFDSQSNLLLIYDQKKSRMTVPERSVAFDEIPTKALEMLMREEFPELQWHYDWRYHAGNNKYDRVRDDVGPLYTYCSSKGRQKECVLCYALFLENSTALESRKREYPFPEFFSLAELGGMSEDIRPEERTAYVAACCMQEKGE